AGPIGAAHRGSAAVDGAWPLYGRFHPAAPMPRLRFALAARPCGDPRDRYARGAANAARSRGADRRRLGGGEIRLDGAGDAAKAPRRLAHVYPAAALARAGP